MLFEELGRALYRGPYFATIGLTLPALPAEHRAEVAAGEASWTLAFGPLVPDLDTAERVAIVGGDGIYELEGGEREILATTDESRDRSASCAAASPGRRLADSGVLAEIEARSQTALALEACGVARLALEDALEYASSREQFGKKIGVYQAVSHPLADAYTRVELSRSLALWAAWCVATGDAQASIAAAAAKSYAGESAVACARRRSSRSAASASRGSTGCTGCTSARSGSRASARPARASGPRSPHRCSTQPRGARLEPDTGRRSHKEARSVDGLMMDYQLNVPAILRRADELYGDNEIASRLPDKSWHRYTYADFVSRTKKLIVALREARPRGRRPRRDVHVEPLAAPRGVHGRAGRRVRHAHAEPPPPPRRQHVHRDARRRPRASSSTRCCGRSPSSSSRAAASST